MSWFDKLESLVGVKSVNISIFSNNKKTTVVNNNVIIGQDVLNEPESFAKLQRLLPGSVANNVPVLASQTVQALDGIARDDEYQDTYKYFANKIPSSDAPILRAALYLRQLFDQGKHVAEYKQDIIDKYGQRGANIANLCSRGYFESHLKPLYEELSSRPNFTAQAFIDNYDLIIDRGLLAIFVNNSMTAPWLVEELSKKLRMNKNYGLHQFNLHAIGRPNVETLQEILRTPEITGFFINDPTVTSQGTVMDVQIYF